MSRRVLLAMALACLLAIGAVVGSAPERGDAAYPGSNGRIAFVSSRDGNDEIYMMRADGREQTNLTKTPTVGEDDPAWDPTGRLLAFLRFRPAGGGDIWLQQIGNQGRNDVPLSSNPMRFPGAGGTLEQGPSWAPLGIPPAIVFETDRGSSELYSGDFNTSVYTLRRLTSNGAPSDRAPAWSPQGDKIAFWSARDQNREIYVMNADGTNQTNLTRNPLESDRDPAWSPDGSKIAYERTIEGSNSEIFVMNADGTGVDNVTGNPADEHEPAWSPDGESIAFVSDRDGNDEIYVMKADGTNQTRLTTNDRSDRDPDWQPLPSTGGVLNLLGMSKETKDSIKSTTKLGFGSALAFCPVLLIPGAGQVLAGGLAGACAGFIAQLISAGVILVVDPPDNRYRQVVMPSGFPAPTVNNSVCKVVKNNTPCSRLKVALLGYGTAEGRVATITESMAVTANRASGAQAAPSKPGIALQLAAARTYWGAYAFALRDRSAAAKRLAREFQRAQVDVTLSPQQQSEGVTALSKLTGVPSSVMSRFQSKGFSRDDIQKALAGALALVPIDKQVSLRALLLQGVNTAALDRDYKKITVADVRAIVDSYRAQGILSASVASTLRARLTRAASASRRRTEMRGFIITVQQRVKRQPQSAFLQVAAAPLAGVNTGLGKGTPAKVTKTQAIASVRAIITKNARRCRLTLVSIAARATSQGWQVTAVVSIAGRTPAAANWNLVGKKIAAADQLAAEIARGCP